MLSREIAAIDGALKANNIDALLTPGGAGAGLASRSWYPIFVVSVRIDPDAADSAFSPRNLQAKPRRSASDSPER